MKKLKTFLQKIGPGVITGASDDDPSGIVIYAQTGAAAGTNLAWTAPFTFPFMVAIQEMCARIGLVTGRGLIGTMKSHYPPVFLISISLLVVIANTINIGSDIAGMAAAVHLFLPINPLLIALVFSLVIIIFMIYFPYRVLAAIFKWLTLALFAYIATALLVVDDWQTIFLNTILPHISLDREQLLLIVAILGTTISPYLFFWQASEEAEEKRLNSHIHKIVTKNELKNMREDVTWGMFFSNLVMFFIIITNAQTLPRLGITNIATPDQAAGALAPLAGQFATLLFTIGIIGTGMLAIPVLAGSAAYAVSEVFGWRQGLNLSWSRAHSFYSIIIVATLFGFLLTALGPVLGITPFKALFLIGIIYGILSPILIVAILHIANNRKILGDKVNGFWSNILGAMTFVLMTAAVVAIFVL
ncbi:divalent metal cation transporter [Candidatus Microgenomates bacterium]|nr:divalent metal cation transporter [Candidatus Microgenomates bacterium]